MIFVRNQHKSHLCNLMGRAMKNTLIDRIQRCFHWLHESATFAPLNNTSVGARLMWFMYVSGLNARALCIMESFTTIYLLLLVSYIQWTLVAFSISCGPRHPHRIIAVNVRQHTACMLPDLESISGERVVIDTMIRGARVTDSWTKCTRTMANPCIAVYDGQCVYHYSTDKCMVVVYWRAFICSKLLIMHWVKPFLVSISSPNQSCDEYIFYCWFYFIIFRLPVWTQNGQWRRRHI